MQTWPIVEPTENADWSQSYQTVGQFMTTDLFTLLPDDLVDLAASVMDWRHIRHVPVEDEDGHLIGLVTHRALLRLLSRGTQLQHQELTVRDIMKTDPLTVSSNTPTLEALEIMRSNKVGCLPVVDNGQLVGIVTSFDFLDASARLFKEDLIAPIARAIPQEELLKKITQLPLDRQREILDAITKSIREQTRPPESRSSIVSQLPGIAKPDDPSSPAVQDSEKNNLSLSQRLYGILEFEVPPTDQEVKDMIADYLLEKYS